MFELSPHPTRDRSLKLCVYAAVTAVTCGALLCLAALAPAPAALMPFIAAVCVGCPMVAAWDLPRALAGFRHHRAVVIDHARAVADLRAGLADLPETAHPLGY